MTRDTEEICTRMKDELHYFHFLAEEDIPILAGYLVCRELADDEVLWEEGGEGGSMVLITSGQLEIMKNTEFEGKRMIVGIYGRGSIAGELSILDGAPREVTATAYGEVELLTLSREDFERLLAAHPELAVRLLKGMLAAVSTRLKKSFERLAAIF